ncbi:hypothetical protein [Micromonospora chersina]|uniref:hypothetical protein n=1 Tax=Micromonospora chersina TaxID=47854 RepID=UPI003717293F
MPNRRNTTLKVIKGALAAGPTPPRRRLVSRTVTGSAEPIEEVLERLDEEPVEEPGEAGDLTVVGDPAGVEDLPGRKPAAPDAGPAAKTTAEGEVDPETGAKAETDARTTAGTGAVPATSSRGWMLPALLVVLLVAALAGAGVYGHRWYVDRATDQARREAVAAARQAAVNFVSVSAASVDRDLQRITAGATGDFKDEFTRGQTQVRKAVVENKVQSQGSVLRAGLVSGDRRRAVVLVAVDATVKNVKAPDGRPSHYRIQLDLVRDRDSGDWLVSKLQFVG